MKTAIMQPYFFPYIGYFQLINAVDNFIILDDVNYINKGWVNRNNIYLNNEKKLITLPIKKASQNKKINEIEILADEKRKNKILKTIEYSYKKAPFFKDTFSLIKGIICFKSSILTSFLYNSIKEICKDLNIDTNIIKSSSIYRINKKADDKIIEICKRENTNLYINPIGGIELYDKKKFIMNDIELKFLKTNTITYTQFNEIFISNLSIIDVLMFNSINDTQKLLNEYKLI